MTKSTRQPKQGRTVEIKSTIAIFTMRIPTMEHEREHIRTVAQLGDQAKPAQCERVLSAFINSNLPPDGSKEWTVENPAPSTDDLDDRLEATEIRSIVRQFAHGCGLV